MPVVEASAAAGCSSIFGAALLHDTIMAAMASAGKMYFFIRFLFMINYFFR
jgi:hypothetical protein